MHSLFDNALHKNSVRPQASGAQTINGAAVDTQGYDTLLGLINIGAASGSPTSFTVDAKLQSSADGSTNWQDTGIAISQASAENQSAQVRLDNLMAAYNAATPVNRYVRWVITVAITGGSSPAVPVSGDLMLGRYTFGPVGNSSTPA